MESGDPVENPESDWSNSTVIDATDRDHAMRVVLPWRVQAPQECRAVVDSAERGQSSTIRAGVPKGAASEHGSCLVVVGRMTIPGTLGCQLFSSRRQPRR